MTEEEYVIRVREQALERGLVLEPSDIHDSLESALGELAVRIAAAVDYQLQQNEWSVALAAGVATLPQDMLIETIDTVLHPDIDGTGLDQYFSRIPDGTRADLANATNPMFPPFVLENKKLYCSLGYGSFPAADDLPPDTATLKITASQIPTLSTLAPQYDTDLIDVGVAIAGGAVGSVQS